MEPPSPISDLHSLDELIDAQSSKRAAAPFLLEARSSRTLSYEELPGAIASIQRQLLAWGVGSGDRVGLLIADPLTFSTWFLAGLATGVWVAPLDPTVTSTNLIRVDERAQSLALSAVFSDRDAPENATSRWHNVALTSANVSSLDALDVADQRHAGGVLLSTSGTTGAPKVMALPVTQLIVTAELIARHNQLEVDDRGFNPLPLWHINAEVVGLLATLYAGASLVLDDRFHRTGFWKIIDDFEVTWINAVPAIISHLVSLQDDERPPRRVRFIRSASAPLSPALFEQFQASTGIPIIQSYGMTEAASQICVNPLDGVRKSGSVGVAVGVEVRVVAMQDQPPSAGMNIVGHIEIKGPTVITSYESSAYDDRFDAEGWLRTGDLGYFDDDDYLFIVGRNDDVINRGGEKIYPLEIENVLSGVDGVDIVAVVGESDEVFGQVPVAFIQPNDVTILSSFDEMTQLVQRVRVSANDAFSKAYRPSVVKLVHRFPSHATGKIRKGLLREGDVVVVHEERL
jgi:acyl-CoA synthetase (AMP-forming)/AMP-acid ligase II